MTSDTNTPSSAPAWHRRHWLVPREQLAAEYESRYGSPAVSAYGLAVRDVVERCPGIGAVDTWSRLAERICRDRPGRDRDTWRKRLSRHFTAETKGPPWQTVVLVVECTVPADEREAALGHFERLYEAARGERPPSGPRPADGTTHPDAGVEPDAGDPARPVTDAAGTRPDDRTRTTVAHLLQENATLRRRLAASEAEIDLLRAALRSPARPAGQGRSRHRPLGGEGRPEDLPGQRESAPPTGTPRGGRNTRHFPVGPAATNDAPAGRHRPPRLD
ncbi:hypothetical protein E1258_16610, partial [Micromonospora sp. KC207]